MIKNLFSIKMIFPISDRDHVQKELCLFQQTLLYFQGNEFQTPDKHSHLKSDLLRVEINLVVKRYSINKCLPLDKPFVHCDSSFEWNQVDPSLVSRCLRNIVQHRR